MKPVFTIHSNQSFEFRVLANFFGDGAVVGAELFPLVCGNEGG